MARFLFQGGFEVIPVWWIIPAVLVGAMFGIVIISVVSSGRDDK